MYDSLIEEHRYINVEHHNWYGHLYEEWTEKLSKMGFTVNQFGFSGFCSQGDGAHFTGRVYNYDFGTFMQTHGLTEEFPAAAYLDSIGDHICIEVVRCSHRYEHENTVEIRIVSDEYGLYDMADAVRDSDDLRDVMLVTMVDKFYDDEVRKLRAQVTEILRDLMREFYRDLEAEYEYLTSDECVLETLKSNDMLEPENEVA